MICFPNLFSFSKRGLNLKQVIGGEEDLTTGPRIVLRPIKAHYLKQLENPILPCFKLLLLPPWVKSFQSNPPQCISHCIPHQPKPFQNRKFQENPYPFTPQELSLDPSSTKTKRYRGCINSGHSCSSSGMYRKIADFRPLTVKQTKSVRTQRIILTARYLT